MAEAAVEENGSEKVSSVKSKLETLKILLIMEKKYVERRGSETVKQLKFSLYSQGSFAGANYTGKDKVEEDKGKPTISVKEEQKLI